MNHKSLALWRNLAGLLSTLCFIAALAFLVDGSQAGARKGLNLSEIVSGQGTGLSGPMPPGAETLDQLLLRANEPGLDLKLTETQSGFWLGGQLWRAEVSAPAALPPGEYTVSLSARNETSAKNTQQFTIRVFADQKALEAASLSLVTGAVGANPFVLAALLVPVGIGFGLLSTWLSRRLAAVLRSQGLGQVFRLQKTEAGLRVFFPLGAEDGLDKGDLVEILDPKGAGVLFTLPVDGLRAADADALLPADARAPINALVRRAPSA